MLNRLLRYLPTPRKSVILDQTGLYLDRHLMKGTKWFLVLELIVMFVIMPVLYVADLLPVHKIIPLVVLLAYCSMVLLVNKPINPSRLSLRANWTLIAVRFVVISVMVMLLIRFYFHLDLIADLQKNRQLFYMILIYPLLSALPQELIFREFFFYRYGKLFTNPTLLVAVNLVLFPFAHIYFANWIVIVFTLVGGAIFALTYRQTRSLLVVSIEHTLYGLMVLSSGLGEYFYKAF
jgi:membrane protease YdiL (CAAX protease family)